MFANDPEATDLEKRGRFFSVQPGAKYNLVLRLHAHQEEYYYGPYASPGYKVCSRVGVKYSTCTWYLYLSTYLSVLDVLEYLVYGNVKVLVLVLVLDQKVLGTYK